MVIKEPIIECDNVGKYFRTVMPTLNGMTYSIEIRQKDGPYWALRNVSFTLKRGEVLGIIGSSGSGKTTLLNLIRKIYSPSEGKIAVNGEVSPLLTVVNGFKPEKTGLENTYYYAKRARLEEEDFDNCCREVLELAEIGNFIDRPVRIYTGDMRARLGLAIVTCLKQDIVLIDEALEWGDDDFKKRAFQKVSEMIADKHTIVIISHHMETIRQFATKVIWLEEGRMKAIGLAEKITKDYRNFD